MNKIKNKLKLIMLLSLTVLMIINIFCPVVKADEVNSANSPASVTVMSPHAILLNSENGQILFEQNAREKAYPASTTKLMTAILTLENCKLEDEVIIDKQALMGIPRSYTTAALQPNEKLTVDQLLHVLLIPSANDAANVLAFHVGGSIEAFAEKMNEKAKEIGCENTHFMNPSGIHNDDHYSTAYDMAKIGMYARKFDTIRQIATNTEYSLPNLPNGSLRHFKTTNTLITPKNQYHYEFANGLKTGYTDKAKSCIVATAQKKDINLMCVVLGGDKTEDKKAQRELDCKTLFEYGFNHFKTVDVCTENGFADKSKIEDIPSVLQDANIAYSRTLNLMVPSDNSYTEKYFLSSNLELPIKKGTVVGHVTYTINGQDYTVDLVNSEDILPIGTKGINYVYRILFIVLVLFIIMTLVKKKRRKSESRYFKRSLY